MKTNGFSTFYGADLKAGTPKTILPNTVEQSNGDDQEES